MKTPVIALMISILFILIMPKKITPEITPTIIPSDSSVHVKKAVVSKETIGAFVTRYTKFESCNFPDGNGGCITASGKVATINHTIACPKNYTFGTQVEIEGKIYVCEDRTSTIIQEKYNPTFDIFEEDYHTALEWGRKKLQVSIIH